MVCGRFSSGISGGWIPCSSPLGLSSHVRGEGECEMGMGEGLKGGRDWNGGRGRNFAGREDVGRLVEKEVGYTSGRPVKSHYLVV